MSKIKVEQFLGRGLIAAGFLLLGYYLGSGVTMGVSISVVLIFLGRWLERDVDCTIDLTYADPCTEVYVCWNHRKIWEVDTTYIGAQFDNQPKTCKECVELIKGGKI